MRAFCTVSAPLEVCASSAEQLSPGSRFLALRLLGNQQPKTLYFLVDAKSRVREVYTQTCLHFATQGMLDTELFGLAVLIDGEYMFADPESKLSKYGPKSWRSSHTHGLDANGRPLLELHFRVQFYIESPYILKDETSRHNYYLQLKYNALQRDMPKEYSEQSMILLAGLALQADLGDAPSGGTTNQQQHLAATTATATATAAKKVAKSSLTMDCGDGGGVDADDDILLCTSNNESTSKTTTAVTTLTTTTTTLPKINKRLSSANERVLRLSSYVSSPAAAAAASKSITAITATKLAPISASQSTSMASSLTSASSTSVFPISGSLKRSLGAMAVSLSASSSTSSINRSSASTTPPTTSATSSSTSLSTQADYFRLEDYLPLEMRTAWAASALRACHRENRGMSVTDAELHYIQHACAVHECINAHIFRMRAVKSENGAGSSWFVVYSKGIKVFSANEGPQQQTTFLWPNITKLSFERKKFEIRSGDNKIIMYASSDEKNKMLLTLCRETHQFSMKIAARLKEVIKREEEESNCLHACYIYSRSLHLPYKNKSDQRISVISSTSSNTTSGIVSDRVHSEDEVEIMINTPPAPIAAPSTESLALAHLLDQPSVSRQTSSVGQVSLKDLGEQLAALSVRQGQQQHSSISGGESPAELSNASAGNSSSSSSNQASQRAADSSTATDSPSSQHNIGSQCSSTCSTVVVVPSSDSAVNTLASLAVHSVMNSTPMQRRNSTSSSLELGFSHTAQNSTLSEAESTCIEHDYTPSTRDESESVSGVYTLAHGAPPTETSGVYTMHSSEMTGQSSEIAESEKSSHYGSFQPAKSEISDDHLHAEHSTLDSVDGGNYHGKRIKNEEFRLRSDSNVSTSGSFRGDGSDPTDNKHNLLSAEELTDLIVGRGSYPSRKTVSSTLDSDCDYVTLPLPIEGESYIQGHQDTAPTEEHVEDLMNEIMLINPPAPPARIDSGGLKHTNLASLSNIRMRSPPPYHARHEKTGLCGPPVRTSLPSKLLGSTTPTTVATATNVPSPPINMPIEVKSKTTAPPPPPPQTATIPLPVPAVIRRRDPPPYPISPKPRPTSLVSVPSTPSANNHPRNVLSTAGGSMTSLKSEEVTARFITTRPQINILKAHTSVVNDNAKPSYAAPTHCSSAASSTGSVSSHHLTGHLSQQSVHNSNYIGGSQASLNLMHHATSAASRQSPMSAAVAAHAAAAAAAGAGVIPSTIGIPIVPYGLHGAHKSMSSLHQQPPPPPPPYPDMKPSPRTCVLLPVIKHRQFLPPPPPSLPRQPPPPPPPQLAGVYGGQLARKQLELYQQQLYSDVDYVIYPIQDPAVSQQEYLDAKQSSILAAMAQTPPPPHPYLAYHHPGGAHVGAWDTCKGHTIYRSTPYLPLALSTHSRYASTQNLSDTYVQLPSAYSPLYSPSMASLCSSYEPPPPPPLHPAALAAHAANTTNLFARSRSDDNILNSLDALPKVKRLPPPPPPPYVNRRLKKPPMPTPTEKPPPIPSKPTACLSSNINISSSSNTNVHVSKSHTPMRSHLPPRKPPTLNTNRSVSHMTRTSSGAQWAGERPKPDLITNHGSSILAHLQASVAAANRRAALAAAANKAAETGSNVAGAGSKSGSASSGSSGASNGSANANALDIAVLREKSKHLDLPLISALCNDHSLLKQTKVFNHARISRGATAANAAATLHNGSNLTTTPNATAALAAHASSKSLAVPTTAAPTANLNGSGALGIAVAQGREQVGTVVTAAVGAATLTTTATTASNSSKYATATLPPSMQLAAANVSKTRKMAPSHRHPNDKLPPLPMQLAEANNYVMDPALLKHHKSYNSQN